MRSMTGFGKSEGQYKDSLFFTIEISSVNRKQLEVRCSLPPELSGMESRMTNQLSGGQQQRVAIARALNLQPDILCFDEPTSALDPELTGEVLRVIRSLAEQKTTMIIVTHEMEFAKNVSDHVIFMDGGKLLVDTDPKTFFGNPENPRLQDFLSKVL